LLSYRNHVTFQRLSIKTTYTEAELIEGLKAHSEPVYGYLYDQYSKALFSIILQIIPQTEAAEDVLQEVFLKIWQNISTYDSSKGRLFTWMLNITRNHAIDRVRSKDFNKQAKTISIVDNVYSNEPSVESRIDDSGLKSVLKSLPEENRKLLELAYFQGYTQDEISKMLTMPLGTVKTKIRSTIIQIRKIIGVKI
jgi:RNA polymerase sigma factor (sigma-70 family)